jgi:hypothetical protein
VEDPQNTLYTSEQRKHVYQKAQELKTLFQSINTLIDSLNEIQNALKKDSVTFRKNKTSGSYYKELQKIKSKLMATTQTSIFADEERLREKVSKLYGAFCEMESAPNETQLESIRDLSTEFKTTSNDYRRVQEHYYKTYLQSLKKTERLSH